MNDDPTPPPNTEPHEAPHAEPRETSHAEPRDASPEASQVASHAAPAPEEAEPAQQAPAEATAAASEPAEPEPAEPEPADPDPEPGSDLVVAEAGEPPAPAGPMEPDEAALRLAEALVFASAAPVSPRTLSQLLPSEMDADAVIAALRARYAGRGVELVEAGGGVQFRTALDLAPRLRKVIEAPRRLPRVAMETLAIIAYHQPVTRAEIEDIRGVALSKGTLDTLMEIGWVKIRGRKKTPGRPVTYGTTEAFLVQFGLESVSHLPGVDELKAAGFLEAMPPSGFDVPNPTEELGPDEEPYTGEEPQDLATGSPNLDEA